MLLERNLGIALIGLGFATSACVTALPAQRPNDTYTTVEGPMADAGADEKTFLDDIQKEIVKQGWEPVTPGEYETRAAQLVARATYEQRWSSSGVTSSPPNATSEKPQKAFFPTKAPRIPVAQYATAYGIPYDFASYSHTDDFSTLVMAGSDIEDMVRDTIHPRGYVGRARLGIAIVPDSADAHRIFTVVIRDQYAEIVEGAPRIAVPGSTFTIRGTLVAKDLTSPELLVLGPDGKVVVTPLTVTDNAFSVSYTLPTAPGIYVASLLADTIDGRNSFYEVGIFSGVDPTPWPPRPAEGTAPPGDAKDAAVQIIQALEDWRVKHGLPILPVKADLCSAAKSEALLKGTLESKNRGGPYNYSTLGSASDRLKAAGVDSSRVRTMNMTWGDGAFTYHLAKFLESPFYVHTLTTPNADALGIGVIVRPKEKQEDPTFYRIVWMVSSAPEPVTPPPAEAVPIPPGPPKPATPAPTTPDEKKAPEPGQPPAQVQMPDVGAKAPPQPPPPPAAPPAK